MAKRYKKTKAKQYRRIMGPKSGAGAVKKTQSTGGRGTKPSGTLGNTY